MQSRVFIARDSFSVGHLGSLELLHWCCLVIGQAKYIHVESLGQNSQHEMPQPVTLSNHLATHHKQRLHQSMFGACGASEVAPWTRKMKNPHNMETCCGVEKRGWLLLILFLANGGMVVTRGSAIRVTHDPSSTVIDCDEQLDFDNY